MKKGFTVIELIIVIIILGILAAIAIPAYLGAQKRAGGSPGCGKAKSVEELLVDLKSADPQIKMDAIRKLLAKDNPAAKQPEIVDWVVSSASGLLDESARWTDEQKARGYYGTLQQYDGNLVTDSLIRHCLHKKDIRLKVLFLGVKLGIPRSEEKLNALLSEHGDVSMAEDFLNSGSANLYAGGKKWGEDHGYYIATGMGSQRVIWGQF